MNKKIMFAIILGLFILLPIVAAHEEYGNECGMMYGSNMWFGPGFWMPGFGMFYLTLVSFGIILLIIYLIINSKKRR